MLRIERLAPELWATATADLLQQTLDSVPDALISFPTGTTPRPLYAELRRRFAVKQWKPARMRVVMLDEYLDPPSEATSFWGWLRRELFDPLQISPARILRLPNRSEGIEAACARFEAELKVWGGCDLQWLGLGDNGHIGFNEPGSDPASRTRSVELTTATARANAAYWKNHFIPRRAVTMGIGTILEARNLALLVRGKDRAETLRQALQGEIETTMPASYLRTAENLYVFADTAAASGLD